MSFIHPLINIISSLGEVQEAWKPWSEKRPGMFHGSLSKALKKLKLKFFLKISCNFFNSCLAVYLFVGEPQAAGEPCSERDPECALGVCRGNSTRFYTRYKFFIGHQSFFGVNTKQQITKQKNTKQR